MRRSILILIVGIMMLSACVSTAENHDSDVGPDTGNEMENGSSDGHEDGVFVSLSHRFTDIDGLASLSPAVLKVKVVSQEPEKVEYNELIFYLSELYVEEVYRDEYGEIKPDSTITLLQNGFNIDPPVEAGEELIIFINKYEGPITEEKAYQLIGLKAGQLKLNNNQLSVAQDYSHPEIGEYIQGKSIDDLVHILKENPYTDQEALMKNNIADNMPLNERIYQSFVYESLADFFSDLNGLIGLTPIVIKAKVETEPEEVTNFDRTFYTSKLHIEEIYRDEHNELEVGSSIPLLQLGENVDPPVAMEEELILFLMPYEGEIVEEAYRLVGMKEGQLKINNDRLEVAIEDSFHRIAEDISGKSIDELLLLLETNPYYEVELFNNLGVK